MNPHHPFRSFNYTFNKSTATNILVCGPCLSIMMDLNNNEDEIKYYKDDKSATTSYNFLFSGLGIYECLEYQSGFDETRDLKYALGSLLNLSRFDINQVKCVVTQNSVFHVDKSKNPYLETLDQCRNERNNK
jgi:hypothetical protein